MTTHAGIRRQLDAMRHIRSLLKFAKDADAPDDIAKIWLNQWISHAYTTLFYPVRKPMSDKERAECIRTLLADGGKELFVRGVWRCTAAKRIALPFFLLAAHGWMLPAKVFFAAYYRLADAMAGGRPG